MRLIKSKHFKQEEKKEKYREELSHLTGIRFSDELSADDKGFPYAKYLINALIMFCSVFGCLNCVVTAFSLDMTVIPMMFTCIISAAVFSFMYVSQKAKIITYLFVLFGIIFSGSVYFSVINSGVNALRNNIFKVIDEKSGLPFLREFTLTFTDEFAAMSIAACLIAVGLMLFVNIFVSERMSLIMLFALTFPFVQFGMFFDLCPSDSSMIMTVSSWVTVAVIKLTDAYNGLTVRAVAESSVKKHRHSYGFVTDSKNTAHISALWVSAVMVLTVIVFLFIPGESFDVSLPTDSVKKYSEKYVKNFLSYGFGSIFAYESKSSAPGSLANVSAIYFDGNADLKATLVNYKVSRIYLKQYSGFIYNPQKKSWEMPEDDSVDMDYINYTSGILKYDFEHNRNFCRSKHRIDVETVDYSLLGDYPAVPYYSNLIDDGYYSVKKSNVDMPSGEKSKVQTYEVYTVDTIPVDYSSLLDSIEDKDEKQHLTSIGEKIKSDAYEYGLEVPERNKTAIEKFCRKYNISSGDDNVIEKVVSALEENYDYTLRPGKVPFNEDYVNYFLLGSEKGYCQHFASAAVLIFRYLGIPARYAEGYAIDSSDFVDSEILYDSDFNEWIEADYSFIRSVNTVSIKDEAGHAWAEVYKDDFGWIPVEATTATPEESKESTLSGVFGNLFNNGSRSLMDGVRKINTEKTKNRCLLLVLFAVLAATVFYFVRMAVTVIGRHKGFNTENHKANLGNRYTHLRDTYLFYAEKSDISVSYRELIDMLSADGFFDESRGCEFYEVLEEFLFSENENNQYSALNSQLIALRRAIVSKMSLTAKLSYYLVKIMW